RPGRGRPDPLQRHARAHQGVRDDEGDGRGQRRRRPRHLVPGADLGGGRLRGRRRAVVRRTRGDARGEPDRRAVARGGRVPGGPDRGDVHGGVDVVDFEGPPARPGDRVQGVTNMKTIIEARNVSKVYGSGETAVTALDGASLSIYPGEMLLIEGP